MKERSGFSWHQILLKKLIREHLLHKTYDHSRLDKDAKCHSKERTNQVCIVVDVVSHALALVVGVDDVEYA